MTTISDIDGTLHNFLNAVDSWDHDGYRKLAEDELVASAKTRKADMRRLDELLETCAQAREKLHRVRVHVAAELNSYVAVNRLPDEILALVFEHHDRNALYLPEYDGRRYKWPTHPTITVASVCVRWRAVALAYPALWSRIDLTASRPHLGLLAERARSHPLLLVYQHFFRECADGWERDAVKQETAKFLKANLHKVLSLVIDGVTHDDHLVYALIQTEAPLLEELRIAGLKFYEPIFGGVAPRVRRLSLHSVNVPWSPGLFANLSSLTVFDNRIMFQRGTDFCDILRSSPHLESLCLERCDRRHDAFVSDAHTHPYTPRTALARLHTLTLVLPIGMIHHLLASFALPALHTAALTPYDITLEHAPSDELALLASLCTHDALPPALFAPLRTLHASVHEQSFDFGVRTLQCTLRAASADDTRAFRLTWALRAREPARMRAVAAGVAAGVARHRFAAARALTLEAGFARRDHPLAPLLRAPGIRSLALQGHGERACLWAAFVEGGAASVCAELRELVLRRLQVNGDALRAVLAWCRSLGGLERMAFEDVRFVPSREALEGILDELRDVVPRVDVSDAAEDAFRDGSLHGSGLYSYNSSDSESSE